MGSADRNGAGTEPKIDRLARLLADERVSRRQVITAGASAVLGITLFEPADTLASIAEKAKRCPKGETRCGGRCCAKGHVCCGKTCCAKGDTCETTHKGRKVTHTCKPPKKSEPEQSPGCGTAADCGPPSSCQQWTCNNGSCVSTADDSNLPFESSPCMTATCAAGAVVVAPAAAHTRCGTVVHTVCDGNGNCVGCASASDCTAAAAGSCRQAVCNSGTCGSAADNSNVPTAASCMSAACVSGAPRSTPLAAETSCGNGLVCDGSGHCLGCASAADCTAAEAGSCQQAVCDSGNCVFTADNTNLPAATACTVGTCMGGTPGQQYVNDGTACGSGGICASGVCGCSSGYCNSGSSSAVQCTAITCVNGTLNTCGATGSCGNYTCNSNADGCNTSCSGPADCVSGYYCNSSSVCVAKQGQGTTCSDANQCASGFCADGYCCNTSCASTCQACSAALKGSGANGICGSTAAGTADSGCTVTSPSSCGTSGVCNGAGACADYSPSTQCASAFCSNSSTLVPAAFCTGSGACGTPTPQNCGTNGCINGACN